MVGSSETSTVHIYVVEDVISRSRSELVSNGKLEESVLSQIKSNWKTKMIRAGIISDTIERSSASIPISTPDPNPLPENADNSTLTDIDAQLLRPHPSMDLLTSIKKEPEEFDIPQQDVTLTFQDTIEGSSASIPTSYLLTPIKKEPEEFDIPQQDVTLRFQDTIEGSSESIPTSYLLTPIKKEPEEFDIPQQDVTLRFQDTIEGSSEWIPTSDHLTPTKRKRDAFDIPQQDGSRDEDIDVDENDEILSEDNDEEGGIDIDDTNILDLVVCQFDNVKRYKRSSSNKWACTLKAGVMQINSKSILFSKATGDFDF